MQMAQPAPAVFAMNQAADNAEPPQSPVKDAPSTPAANSAQFPDASASPSVDRTEQTGSEDVKKEETADTNGELAGSTDSNEATAVNSAPAAEHNVSLKLRLSEPAAPTQAVKVDTNGSRRRSERIRNVTARSEELRRAREERAAAEKARSEARSAAARKGVKTKRKAAQVAAAGFEPPPKRVPKQIVTLRYMNPVVPPTFEPIDVGDSSDVFWQRANLREFLLRFDKLCRVPARFTPILNDPLAQWTPDLFKAVILAMLKLIQNDASPLHSGVRTYMAEIDQLDASDPKIWEWLLEFVEQLDAYAPTAPPATEAEQLELVRRLMVICTGTETIRITVMSDVDQLKLVEKDANDEVKQVYAKLKETEQKLAKLKQVDKQVHKEKVAAAQRSAEAKVWRAQQQLYQKVHKFNMRTTPMAVDDLGNKFWSLQYKSKEHSSWGSWIICEYWYDPAELADWHQRFGHSVDKVLKGRDEMIAEKNAERKRQRKQARENKLAAGASEAGVPGSDGAEAPESADGGDNSHEGEQRSHAKRRYPKLKIDFPKPLSEPRLYFVEGRDNIAQLAEWVGGLRGVEPKMKTDIEQVANYLASE